MTNMTQAPTRLSSWGAVSAACVALSVSGFYSWAALLVGVLGLVLLTGGLIRGANAAVTLGAFSLFIGAIIAGVRSAPVVPVLISVTSTVLAWDIGGSAISIGKQLGRDADTARIEMVHMAASICIGVMTAGVGYSLYLIGTGDQPVAALVFLLLAAVLLVETLG